MTLVTNGTIIKLERKDKMKYKIFESRKGNVITVEIENNFYDAWTALKADKRFKIRQDDELNDIVIYNNKTYKLKNFKHYNTYIYNIKLQRA